MVRQEPTRRDPPAAWLRLRYSKLGPLRFTSARDVARLMERALKRADLPVAYSSGFSPHQRVSYAFPAPTGAASWAEYMLVGLTQPGDPDILRQTLNDVLPDMRIEGADLGDSHHLSAQLEASRWRVDWPESAPANLAKACQHFMGQANVVIQRRAKSGVSQQDVRGAVVSLTVSDLDGQPTLVAVLRQDEPLIRPTDVLAGMGVAPGLLTRLAQGSLTAGGEVVNLV